MLRPFSLGHVHERGIHVQIGKLYHIGMTCDGPDEVYSVEEHTRGMNYCRNRNVDTYTIF